MINLESEIKKLGLSDKETKIYLASLELGQAPVAEIAAHSGINRATAYVILEELRHKGLVSIFLKGKKTIFAAESPERLSNLFETEKKRLEENFSGLKKILPDLKKSYESMGEHPKTRLFEGSEGIDSLRGDILKTKTKLLYQILPLDAAPEPSKKKFYDKKIEKLYEIHSKSIYWSKNGEIFPEKSGKAEYKFLANKFDTEIIIYGGKVAFINSKRKPVGVIISDFDIHLTMKTLFEVLWKYLK